MNETPSGTRSTHCFGVVIVCVACLFLQGCSRSDSEPPPDLLKAQREALQKAKATDQAVQDAAERQRQQVESQQK
ncbi:MAG: hypothetical protein JO133_02015 [Burkholderiaceae bacterium]|nr:hypothetical protein [Burkholderiaceae bacterium]